MLHALDPDEDLNSRQISCPSVAPSRRRRECRAQPGAAQCRQSRRPPGMRPYLVTVTMPCGGTPNIAPLLAQAPRAGGQHRWKASISPRATARHDGLLLLLPPTARRGQLRRSWRGGRILRTYDHQTFSNTWIILVRELVYEHVRREQFPTKPSRLDCLLLCMSEDDLSEFHAASGRRLDYRYEVELVNPLARGHLGDLTLTGIKPTDDVAAIERSASLYWQGTSIAKPELATLSPIWITRRLKRRARWRLRRSG